MRITEEAFTQAMEEVVREAGEDHVYDGDSCRYVQKGEPGCLIGRVLFRLGVPLETLVRADGFAGVGGLDASSLIADIDPDAPYRLRLAARDAQIQQDGGEEWGHCLRVYRDSL